MSTGWLAVRWLHVVAMALFVVGQLFLAIAVVWLGLRLAYG